MYAGQKQQKTFAIAGTAVPERNVLGRRIVVMGCIVFWALVIFYALF